MIAKVNWMNEFRHMMQRVLKNKWAEQWITASLVLLFIGLMVSRAMVSFASVLIVVPFFFNLKEIKRTYLLAIVLLLLPVLLSGYWSTNKGLWWNSLSVKLPLLTMMLGLSSVQLSEKRWEQIIWIFLLVICIGCCWSLLQYSTAIQDAYLKAKTLPTPADNDHIRFSWLVAIAILLAFRCLLSGRQKSMRPVLFLVIVFLVTYLHILAAKTGLVCLYAGCLFYFLYAVIVQKKWKTALSVIVIATAIASFYYYTMPTLRNRIQYVMYDFDNYSKGNIMPGYGDASRWLSIRAGYEITTQHPLGGVGFGDILNQVDQWHQSNHPSSLFYERFLPANEWLVYGAGSGWPGLICFTAGLLLLLFAATSNSGLSIVLSLTSLIPFLIDDTLEGQNGVVILAFIVFFGQQKLTAPLHE
ncbi:MAG: O-antigen ligase family protein [Bacteroidota bacterium]